MVSRSINNWIGAVNTKKSMLEHWNRMWIRLGAVTNGDEGRNGGQRKKKKIKAEAGTAVQEGGLCYRKWIWFLSLPSPISLYSACTCFCWFLSFYHGVFLGHPAILHPQRMLRAVATFQWNLSAIEWIQTWGCSYRAICEAVTENVNVNWSCLC